MRSAAPAGSSRSGRRRAVRPRDGRCMSRHAGAQGTASTADAADGVAAQQQHERQQQDDSPASTLEPRHGVGPSRANADRATVPGCPSGWKVTSRSGIGTCRSRGARSSSSVRGQPLAAEPLARPPSPGRTRRGRWPAGSRRARRGRRRRRASGCAAPPGRGRSRASGRRPRTWSPRRASRRGGSAARSRRDRPRGTRSSGAVSVRRACSGTPRSSEAWNARAAASTRSGSVAAGSLDQLLVGLGDAVAEHGVRRAERDLEGCLGCCERHQARVDGLLDPRPAGRRPGTAGGRSRSPPPRRSAACRG